MNYKKILMALVFAIGLTSCSTQGAKDKNASDKTVVTDENATDLKKYNAVFYDYFDTVTEFLVYAKDEEEFENYKKILEDDLSKYNKLFNTYYDFDEINNVKTINENAGKEAVKVDPAIIELLDYSKEIYNMTDGKINMALGDLISLWHEYREAGLADEKNAAIPSDKELKEAASHSDIEKIEIDHEKNTVYIKDPDIKIDVGAEGKGYAIKKMKESLEKAGMKHGILSVGGDDVIIGKNPARADGLWKIAIVNPEKNAKKPYASVVDIKDNTVVTSGDYQRFYVVDGQIYHHIIDSDTNYPSKYFKSVSVIHPDIALSDALSTYLFTVDLETGKKVAEKYKAEVLWIDYDGNYYKTEGYEKLESKSEK
ncbi:FAD:protein FMN transferase [uncultured Anaerococcus sp.]|uniref:FAD:protein FMN transferase n=1 Tax=uncultured Anaerococcus sp. TaxID=293428 RepID=UPI0025E505B7|nr:FAD:protein FMN transferase [uncultured Anaerococcus sp.]